MIISRYISHEFVGKEGFPQTRAEYIDLIETKFNILDAILVDFDNYIE